MNNLRQLSENSVIIDLLRFATWEDCLGELKTLTLANKAFWGNTSLVLRFADFPFFEEEAKILKELIDKSSLSIWQIQTNSIRSWKVLKEQGFQVSSIPNNKVSNLGGGGARLIKEAKQSFFSDLLPPNHFEGKTAFVGAYETIALRAGSSISYNGNLIIIGDVNPGCQIKLTGSIIVYGKLCGSVHAGFGITDDEEVQQIFVKALKMGDPLQISIGEYSACSSNQQNGSDAKQKIYPETARVIDGRIWRISDFE